MLESIYAISAMGMIKTPVLANFKRQQKKLFVPLAKTPILLIQSQTFIFFGRLLRTCSAIS